MLRSRNKKGFTIIEALMAVSVFTISIVTLLTVLGKGISDINHAKRKTTSIYLAQEGVEFMRNMRDTYMLYNSGTGWSLFDTRIQAANCHLANGCFYNDTNLDYNDQSQPIADNATVTLTACNTTCTNGALSYNTSTGKYGFSGTASGFTRKINATIVSANEILITSTVSWTKGAGNYSAVLTERLFNWAD